MFIVRTIEQLVKEYDIVIRVRMADEGFRATFLHRERPITVSEGIRRMKLPVAILDHLESHEMDAPPAPEALIAHLSVRELLYAKYDRFLPEPLVRTAYARDRLETDAALAWLATV